MPKPKIENVEPFSELEKLNLEKEVVGIYISGHPLENFKLELTSFCNVTCNQLGELEPLQGKDVRVGGIVTSVEHRTTKTGKPFGKFVLEDFSGNSGKDTFTMFGETYMKFRNFINNGLFIFIEGNVMRSNWGQMNVEYKIRNIELLDEIAQKRIQGSSLKNSAAKCYERSDHNTGEAVR
jgi:DNA polymerase-3 subunit alpha